VTKRKLEQQRRSYGVNLSTRKLAGPRDLLHRTSQFLFYIDTGSISVHFAGE